jgi:hypothetical protein
MSYADDDDFKLNTSVASIDKLGKIKTQFESPAKTNEGWMKLKGVAALGATNDSPLLKRKRTFSEDSP